MPQYYGDTEAKKYTNKYVGSCFPTGCPISYPISSRIRQIQADMAYRALELLNLPPDQPAFLLDIGCGSGLSGEILDEQGHVWVGVDIAPSMLGISALLYLWTWWENLLLLLRVSMCSFCCNRATNQGAMRSGKSSIFSLQQPITTWRSSPFQDIRGYIFYPI